MDHLLTLFGIVLSSVLAFFVGKNMERHKWQLQRREKLDEKRREAITAALAWLDPMDTALMTAESNVTALLHERIDEDVFRRSYPNLLSQLAKMDLSPEHRILLPKDLYSMGNKIHRTLDQLQYLAIELAHDTRLASKLRDVPEGALQTDYWLKNVYRAADELKALKILVNTLRQRLNDEYEKTLGP